MAEKERTQKATAQGPETTNGDEAIDQVPLYRKRRVVIPLAIILLLGAAGIWWWFVDLRGYVSSDDAYIDANRVSISSKILGRIRELTVDEADSVSRGEVLVRLDESDLRAQMAQASAALQLALESISLAKVNSSRAQDDFQRADQQFRTAVITKEQYDHAKSALAASRAELAIALSRVGTAKAQVGIVQAQLDNCTITSPVNGRVAKRWALQGDVVQAAQPIFSVYDEQETWVTANLEETNMDMLRLGENVEITVDGYPDVAFSGKV
ncbi:MAG TPA: efflux RND transporter periplasmic adaptor subunit, partial [Bacteroidota bacterium]|nr:efflux RND transporter periplasmic adaptor subunit [Bacteroidota bacterium]